MLPFLPTHGWERNTGGEQGKELEALSSKGKRRDYSQTFNLKLRLPSLHKEKEMCPLQKGEVGRRYLNTVIYLPPLYPQAFSPKC